MCEMKRRRYRIANSNSQVTPDHISDEVEKAVAFYNETVASVTQFYEEQITRLLEFHKAQCDRYFKHSVPMINNQIDAMERAFGGEFSAWNDTVFCLGYTLSASLANLAVLSTEPISEDDHPSAQFVSRTTGNADIDESLKAFQAEMLKMREGASRYRENEREEIQRRFRELTEKRERIETAAESEISAAQQMEQCPTVDHQ